MAQTEQLTAAFRKTASQIPHVRPLEAPCMISLQQTHVETGRGSAQDGKRAKISLEKELSKSSAQSLY
jgi:hypothetical protein